jgi:two-component system sensor histidine kinase HydH
VRTKVGETELNAVESIVNSMPTGVLAVDADRRILHCNARCEEILKTPAGKLLGRDCLEVIKTADDRWISTDPVDTLGTNREIEAEVAGEELELLTTPLELRSPSGETLGTLVLLDNASEVEIDDAQRTDRLAALGELSACVAHEIRNPLTGIRTTVQFIGSKFEQDDARRQDIEDIIRELDRIEQIITDMLLFARPPIGKPDVIDANEIVSGALDSLTLQMERANIASEKKLVGDLPAISFDPDLLYQVFLNILLNAIEAMPDGGRIKVRTSSRKLRSRKTMVDIRFTDGGCGIDREHKEKIFAPFFTTRPKGTGLGLPISLQIVRAHGGTITARNNPKAGATFRVSVPAISESGGKK